MLLHSIYWGAFGTSLALHLPCQCVLGALTVNPVFTFTVIFLAPIMYFTVCTFCISIKMEMEMPIWLLRK